MTADLSLYARPLFTYGTLQDADVFKIVTRLSLDAFVKAPAWLSNHCVRGVRDGLFPIVLSEMGARAAGTLIFGLPHEALDELVSFELPEFAPRTFDVETIDGSLHSTVFWPIDPTLAVSDSAWSLDQWTLRKKAEWLRQVQRRAVD